MSFPAERLSPSRRDSTRPRTESREAFAGTGSHTLARLFEERDDIAQGGSRSEHGFDPGTLQFRFVLLRDDAPSNDDDVPRLPLPEQADDLGKQRHVGAAQGGQADRVDVLLDRGLDDVLGRLPKARVDHLHARVPQRPGDDLRPAVVSIEARLRDQDADLLPDRTTSVEERLLPDAEDLSHHVADLAEGRLRPYRFEDDRHCVVVGLAGFPESVECPGVLLRVPRPAKPPESVDLSLERGFRHPERLDVGLLVDDVIVHPDDRSLLSSTSRWYRYAEFAISCWKNPFRIAGMTPPRSWIRSKYR